MKKTYLATLILLAVNLIGEAQLVNNGAIFYYNSDTSSNYLGPNNGFHNKAGSTFIGAATPDYPFHESRGMYHKAGVPTLINDGSYVCNAGYYDCFLGPGGQPGVQSIEGTVRPKFNYLRIDNGDVLNITNTDGIEVNNVLQMRNSIVTTVRSLHHQGAVRLKGPMTMMDPGSYSDAVHINGYLSKVEFQANFPNQLHVGSGTDRREIRLISPVNSTDEYSVAWISGDPSANGDPSNNDELHPVTNLGSGLTAVSPVGQWDWVPVTGNGAGMQVMAFFPDMTSFATKNELRLAGWNGTQWVDLSGAPTALGNGEDTCVIGTMIAGIQALAIAKVSSTLPVNFQHFTARLSGVCTASIQWQMATEATIERFDVQRYNGTRWDVIGNLLPTNGKYVFTDKKPVAGQHQYRIAAIEKSGQVTYSQAANVYFNCGESLIAVYPNPATHTIQLDGLPNGASVTIWNAAGINVYSAKASSAHQSIRITSWPAGVYVVQVEHEGEMKKTVRLSKSH